VRGVRNGCSRILSLVLKFSHCRIKFYCQGLPRDRKDGVMCKVGITDYSVGGVF
jgi:hypothetical protein